MSYFYSIIQGKKEGEVPQQRGVVKPTCIGCVFSVPNRWMFLLFVLKNVSNNSSLIKKIFNKIEL
jgi:hypothetical protein